MSIFTDFSVNGNSWQPMAITLLRNVIIAVAGTNAYVTDDVAGKVASAIVTLCLMSYGAYKAYRTNEQKKELAAPNVAAIIK